MAHSNYRYGLTRVNPSDLVVRYEGLFNVLEGGLLHLWLKVGQEERFITTLDIDYLPIDTPIDINLFDGWEQEIQMFLDLEFISRQPVRTLIYRK